MGPRKSTNLSATSFREALALRSPDKDRLVLHSDNGGENRSFTMLRLTSKHCKAHSWSRKHTPADNPIMEAFFKYFRDEVLYHGDFFRSEAEIKREMERFKDRYNNERIHTALKGCTPIEYEQKYPCVFKIFTASEEPKTKERYLEEPETMEYVNVDANDVQGIENQGL